MGADARVEFNELLREGRVIEHEVTQTNKRAHDVDSHFGCGITVEHIRRLNCPVFREGVGQSLRPPDLHVKWSGGEWNEKETGT